MRGRSRCGILSARSVIVRDVLLHRWYDEPGQRVSYKATDVKPVELFSTTLLEQADGRWLMVEGDKITLDMDNGKWVYVVTDVNKETGVVTAEWPD